MASATFANETPSGWQQVNFATPVPINASLIYVASYHSTSGHYSADENYFSSVGKDNSPLHAPASAPPSGSWGANGVYAYGAGSVFPNQSFNNTNYWVDVVLQAGTGADIELHFRNAFQRHDRDREPPSSSRRRGPIRMEARKTSPARWPGARRTSVATISTSGLATAVAAGSTTITASQSGVLAYDTDRANNALTITTTSLPNGAVNSPTRLLSPQAGELPLIRGRLPASLGRFLRACR